MSIDYDRLQRWLDMVDDVDSAGLDERAAAYSLLEQTGPDAARELLALRSEIMATRDRVADELERTPVELRAARITLYAEREHFLEFCDRLLEGDQQ